MRIIRCRPTPHYWKFHSDVGWELVLKTVMSPDKIRKSRVANRYLYFKKFKKWYVRVDLEYKNGMAFVINAFKKPR